MINIGERGVRYIFIASVPLVTFGECLIGVPKQ
jgi:hypothetical protein